MTIYQFNQQLFIGHWGGSMGHIFLKSILESQPSQRFPFSEGNRTSPDQMLNDTQQYLITVNFCGIDHSCNFKYYPFFQP